DQGNRQLAGVAAEAAVTTLTQGIGHARAGAAVAPLGPDEAALAAHIGSRCTAVAAHAAEDDNATVGSILLGQIEHHLVDGGAVGFRPATFGELHLAILAEAKLVADRR